MSNDQPQPTFDEAQGHRFFATNCFNRTWELIDMSNRTEADNEQMLLRAYSSFWHWTQRDDCTARNLSIGYWLLSRVHALLKHPDLARQYGELSLKHAGGEPPFFVGYAHEALARAARVAGDHAQHDRHLTNAWLFAAKVTEAEDRKLLEKDLESLV